MIDLEYNFYRDATYEELAGRVANKMIELVKKDLMKAKSETKDDAQSKI